MRVARLLALCAAASGCLYEAKPDTPAYPPQPAYQPAQPQPTQPPPAYQPPAQQPQPAPQPVPEAAADDPAPPQLPPGYDQQQPQAYEQQPGDDDGALPAPAGTDVVSDQVFVDSLSPYGNWTEVSGYGRVWVPAVSYGWRPYYYGRWELTDWGWTFVSSDPWGWAAYHYGRWNWGLGVGWYWVPGHQWGPAWVSWRYGGGYVSWAPLGPRGVVFGFGHPGWVAVGEARFTQPIARVAITGKATVGVVTAGQPLSSRVVRGGAFGPPVARINAATGHPVVAVPATRAIGFAHAQAVGPRSAVNPILRSPSRAPRPNLAGPAAIGRPGGVSRPGGVVRPPGPGVVRPSGPGVTRPIGAGQPAGPRPAGVPRPGSGVAHPSNAGHEQHK
jgi:hypothetical protein